MTKLEKISNKYAEISAKYRQKYPVLKPINTSEDKKIICGLCGANVYKSEITGHLQKHNETPPNNLAYQLCLPFRTVNGLIKRGKTFVKLIILYSPEKGITSHYNGLNLQDWQKLTDVNDVKIRYSKSKKRFIRTLWIIVILLTVIFVKH